MSDTPRASEEERLATDRLDEWTESAIREVLNAGLKHGPKDKLSPPTDCPLCSAPIAALRSRIRTLIEEARNQGAAFVYWRQTKEKGMTDFEIALDHYVNLAVDEGLSMPKTLEARK